MNLFSQHQRLRNRAFIVFLLGLSALALWLLRPYWMSVFWAVVFASVFWPLREGLAKRLGEQVAASLTLVIIMAVVLIPLSLVTAVVASQAYDAVVFVSSPAEWQGWVERYQKFASSELLAPLLPSGSAFEQLSVYAAKVGQHLFSWLQAASTTTAVFVARLFVMLFMLFYFLRDGEYFLRRLLRVIPFGDSDETELFNTFLSTTRATLKGMIVIALLQGAVAGVAYYLLGLPLALLLTIVTIVGAMIPALGPNLVLIPATAYMVIQGDWTASLILGAALIIANTVDNLVRPILVGRDSALHPALILLGTVGGLTVFGLPGIIVGPVILSLLIAALRIYERRYKAILEAE